MKLIVATLVLISAQVSFAGHFVQKNLYSRADLAVGTGRTLSEAIADAKSSIPAANKNSIYEADSMVNSPAFQCSGINVWTEKTECGGEEIQYVIPLKHVTL